MSIQILKEGLDRGFGVHNTIKRSISRIHFLFNARVLLIALPLSIAYPPQLTIPQPFVQHDLLLTRDSYVVKHVKPSIVITPGLSNAENEVIEQRKRLQEQLDQNARLTGIPLRSIEVDYIDEEIAKFLSRAGSPLAGNARDFVDAGSEYGMDPRLLVGISGIESSFGTRLIPYTHNPFGLGPNIVFTSYRDAIFAEAAFLRRYFYDRGITSPLEIGPRYTGTGSETWGPAVAQFMRGI